MLTPFPFSSSSPVSSFFSFSSSHHFRSFSLVVIFSSAFLTSPILGSPFADWIVTHGETLYVNSVLRRLGIPTEAFYNLRASPMIEFNNATKDVPGIPCLSLSSTKVFDFSYLFFFVLIVLILRPHFFTCSHSVLHVDNSLLVLLWTFLSCSEPDRGAKRWFGVPSVC
jgi:hypothetical protein